MKGYLGNHILFVFFQILLEYPFYMFCHDVKVHLDMGFDKAS